MTISRPDQARAARRDFRTFLWYVWRHLGLPPPTPVQIDMARYLQTGPSRRVVLAFRGVGKSWIYAAYLVWRLWRRPDDKVLLVSASQGAAESLARFARRLIREIDALAPLRPTSGQRDGATAFDVGLAQAAKDPSARAVGVGGQITGARADEILADDVETLNNSQTAASRAKLEAQVREFDAVLRPGGRITVLGTPQSADSLYPRLASRGYRLRYWPAEIPPDERPYGGALAPMIRRARRCGGRPGDPVDAARFDRAELARRRLGYGPTGYAMQFLLDARPAEPGRHPLRLSDLIVMPLDPTALPLRLRWAAPDGVGVGETDADPLPMRGFPGDRYGRAAPPVPPPAEDRSDMVAEAAPFEDAVLAIDSSGRGRDETGFAVVAALAGRLFLLASGGRPGGYDIETLEALAALAARYRTPRVVVESNFGDGMFSRLLADPLARAGAGARLSEARAHGAKEARIVATLEPLMTQHRLVVDRAAVIADAAETEAAPHRSVFHQLARIMPAAGSLAADDRLDALALGAQALKGALAVDLERAAERGGAAADRRAARAVMRALSGRTAARRGWMTRPR